MLKVGTDICSVARIKQASERFGQRFLERIFTEREIQYLKSQPAHLHTRLAGRFAAKEACSKVLGTGWRGLSFKEIEIVRQASGEPTITLAGRAEKVARLRGIDRLEVTISHEREYAVAFVIGYSSETKL
jgi:holo-[acyl-carrier protein] synthase